MQISETSGLMIMISLINGMIGGVILVLPLLALQSGTISSGLIITALGVISYYSCKLCVKHLGQYSDLDEAIYKHFNHRICVKIFYDFIVFLNLFLLLILYFDLIVKQWQGMVQSQTVAINLVNFLVLIIVTLLMKYLQFGVSLLAYGIISCVGYCIFLIWMLASAPTGPNTMEMFGPGSVTLAASMGQAFSIQTIFIPILRKNSRQQNYQNYTLMSFVAGYLIYMYIAYMGSFGILNREPVKQSPQTIQQYFGPGYWQLVCLQIIYLVHLYSVFPQFLLISKKRFFSIFGISSSESGTINVWEAIYILILIGICLTISLLGVEIGDIIQINGAVVGFFFIYFFPIFLHAKCIYFDQIIWAPNKQAIKQVIRRDKSVDKIKQIQITHIQSSQDIKQSLLPNAQSSTPIIEKVPDMQAEERKSDSGYLSPSSSQRHKDGKQNYKQIDKKDHQQVIQQKIQIKCYATRPQNLYQMVFDISIMLIMLAMGCFVMYQGIKNVFM